MKKKCNYIRHKGYLKHIIAGILIVCMLFADASLYLSITSDNLPYANKSGDFADISGNDFVVYENHLLDVAMADGKYDGTDSSFEISNGGDDQISSSETLYHFNILEIVRGEGLGTIGFSIAGLEPVQGDTAEMRHACMDALVNGINGGDQNVSKNERPNYINNFMTQFSGGNNKPFTTEFKDGGYTGYYKYVGTGNGFYSLVKGTLDTSSNTAQMVSKYYSDDVNSDRKNDYIWVDTDLSISELVNSDTLSDDDIIVTNHRKNKYVNNDVFLKNFYSTEEYDSTNGSYKATSIDKWKKTHKVQLRTKAYGDVLDDDIEWADLIYISNGDGVYAQSAYEIYKKAFPDKSLPDRDNLPKINIKNFQQVLAIYDRVAVRQDVAILVDGKQAFNGNNIDNNFCKLVAMLFLVNNVHENGGKYGSGREMFMDFLNKYVNNKKAPGLRTTAPSNRMNGLQEENGYMYQDFPRTKVSQNDYYDDESSEYFDENGQMRDEWAYFKKSKSNTTDYIYIDEETGDFRVNTQYSGYYYWVDYEIYNDSGKHDGFAHRYVSWTRQSDHLGGKDGSSRWPWDIVEGGCLKYWWVAKDVTDQQAHLPLYFQYYHSSDYWGPYVAINDPVTGNYKNQSFSQENYSFNDNLLKDAIENREVKREYTDPSHGESTGSPKYFFLALNIENGDGVNKTNMGNKVLYVNDYEIRENRITELPIHFILRSSENISRIELLKEGQATPIVTFSPKSTNDITKPDSDLSFTGGVEGLELQNETIYTSGEEDSKKPDKDTSHHDLYIYKYKGVINNDLKADYFSTDRNNKFVLRAWIEPVPNTYKYVDDKICVVRRDFFMLD